MPNCTMCNDKGYIDTGNNDDPCTCPLGLTAKFNTAWTETPQTGKQVREFIQSYSLRENCDNLINELKNKHRLEIVHCINYTNIINVIYNRFLF